MALSKSDYLLFLKHPAWLWLKKHDKAKLELPSDNLQSIFDSGFLFESYAEKLFPEGVRIGFSNYDEYLSQPSRTIRALEDGATIVLQGRFEKGNITCICDLIKKIDDKTVDLYEIKSSTEVKPIHEYDLTFQTLVLEGCGYTVRRCFVLCVNGEYIRIGAVDPTQLVIETDVTNAILEKKEDVRVQIQNALDVVALPTIPNTSPSLAGFQSLKEWLDIYKSMFPVEKGSIYDLCRINTELLREFEKRNIQKIIDIPDDIQLKPQQELQVQVTKTDEVVENDGEIQAFLSRFEFPLYFLDYETLSSVIPEFDGIKPYQQVPFQYSLHILTSPTAEIQHVGYLHMQKTNPVFSLSESLKSHIGTTGTILVWYENFEKSRNTEMGEIDSQFREFYKSINSRILDLMIPFSQGWYVHKDFLGSASIKKVLPVLVPELSHKDLEIQEGNTAQRLWMETVLDQKHDSEKDSIYNNLEKYCELDTLAMVKIYQKLTQI